MASSGDEGGEGELGAVLYQKGKEEVDESAWDDTALIQAYDRAVSLTYDLVREKLGDGETSKATGSSNTKPTSENPKKKRVRTKKGKVTKNWSESELCMAPYSEDGEYYLSRIISISQSERTALICFEEYGDEETVPLASLRPVSSIDENNDLDAEEAQKSESTPKTETAGTSLPSLPPPPLPAQLASATLPSSQEALSAMLMSWYMTGYHTGYYQALRESEKRNA